MVFAVTTPDIGTRGISAFIVEKGWKGFEFGDHYDKMGIRSSSTAELIFNDVKIPKENLLGKEGEGFKIAMSTLDGGRIGIAAQALSYSKERIQFGKPIAAQQSIAFKLADMATKLRCARFLIYSAAELKEQHAPYGMESAMAKMYASDIALEVTNDALQIHGGSGFLKGMEVERAYRDAKITTICGAWISSACFITRSFKVRTGILLSTFFSSMISTSVSVIMAAPFKTFSNRLHTVSRYARL